MTDHPLIRNPRTFARLSGLAYLAIIGLGIFAQMGVRGQIIDWSDAGATADQIRLDPLLLRAGILADLTVFVLDIVLAVMFYRLLAPAGRGLALFAMAVRITMTAVLCVNLLNMMAPLVLLGDGPIAAQLDPAMADAASLVFLGLHNEGYILGLMLFGLHCACLGILLARADYFPAFLGWLMGLSGLSYISLGIIHFGLPESGAIGGLLLLPAALPEFVFTGWLLAVGLNRSRWDAVMDRQRTSRARIEPSSART
jgi:Domain of unknown function (DUF4386)